MIAMCSGITVQWNGGISKKLSRHSVILVRCQRLDGTYRQYTSFQLVNTNTCTLQSF